MIDLAGVTVTHMSSASDAVNSLTISSSDSTLNLSDGLLSINSASTIAGSLIVSGPTQFGIQLASVLGQICARRVL